MFPPLKSLKSRLTLWVFLPTILISAVDLIVTYSSTDNIATLVQQQLLKGSAKIISEQLSKVDGGYEISIPPSAFELFANEYKDRVYYSVRSKEGRLIAGDEELAVHQPDVRIEQEKYYITQIRGEPVRVITYAHTLPSTKSNDYAVTQVAQTLTSHDAFKKDLFLLTIREHLILLSIVLIGLIIAFRWTLSPLIRFGEKLLERQPGSLEKLDENEAPAELKPVIFAMNDYVTRLDKTLSSYEQFVANTAHQLRTSFAIVTSQINFGNRNSGLDQTQREVLKAIQKTILQGTKVINQLLVLAAVEQNRHGVDSPPPIRVAEIVKSVLEELAPLAQQKNIDLGIDKLDENATIAAPQYLLRELISNLIDNAIQHMRNKGMITISLREGESSVALCIVDNGPGIPEEQRQKVFERFYRLDESKPNSSGLGLSIVKEICDSLAATIKLSTPEHGIGLRVDIEFPKKI
ncbi:sensor histidine kinase [Undibacterium sp.]|jgi:two-component system sensor histidine kinase TctE|uniref:sensor histidine kinase n=1 Tax=Undibacterium sp. TaxID=1914977 RepID=UPI002C5EFCBB|nr:sensor histidine kinase [Undibacterium sp.]HTD05780.1 sensor histidine kinase [Undibacterium sp.]